jgi:hypothetical protein
VIPFEAFLALMLAAFLPASARAQAAPPLTNDDVIKMVQAKLPDAVVVAKIKSSPCKLDTSADTLIKLRQAGLSDAVMQAMVEAGSPVASSTSGPAPSQPPPDPNDPLAEHDPGIYYVRQNPGGRRMTQLEPTAYSGAKSAGIFTSQLTYGIAKAKWKAIVRGQRADVRITEPMPRFYFYFEQKHGTLSYAGSYMFGGLSTPSQFTLARLAPKKDHRELIVGEWGLYGASSGTREKDIVPFDFKKVAPGIYEVTLRNNLQPGEYCFFNTGQTTAAGTVGTSGPVGGGSGGGMLFDFGINPSE